VRATVELKCADGKTLHVRKASRAEPRQQRIYDALGISHRPGKTEKNVVPSFNTSPINRVVP